MVKIAAGNEIHQRITQFRNEVVYSVMEGNYKKYKQAAVENAKYTLAHFDAVKEVKRPKISVPLFSKYGMRFLKIMVLNFFRIKSPEEKQLKQLAKKARINEDNKYDFMKEG